MVGSWPPADITKWSLPSSTEDKIHSGPNRATCPDVTPQGVLPSLHPQPSCPEGLLPSPHHALPALCHSPPSPCSALGLPFRGESEPDSTCSAKQTGLSRAEGHLPCGLPTPPDLDTGNLSQPGPTPHFHRETETPDEGRARAGNQTPSLSALWAETLKKIKDGKQGLQVLSPPPPMLSGQPRGACGPQGDPWVQTGGDIS